jgi:hypothetical protein
MTETPLHVVVPTSKPNLTRSSAAALLAILKRAGSCSGSDAESYIMPDESTLLPRGHLPERRAAS